MYSLTQTDNVAVFLQVLPTSTGKEWLRIGRFLQRLLQRSNRTEKTKPLPSNQQPQMCMQISCI